MERSTPDGLAAPHIVFTTPVPIAELERLGDEIAELAARLDAATARLLDLIRELDAREGWSNGFRSCAAWLAWRVGFGAVAAREHVRVARALGTLPRLAEALARGELSYAKVRELTRVATPETVATSLRRARTRIVRRCGYRDQSPWRGWSIIRPMQPREETISVGGVGVHTWIGGQGAPLLVLHGAGGNRGWTRWVEQVSEHYTVWVPTHPGFGRSADAEWMEGVDDLARFYLWFIDVAGLGRPHVLGQSLGGWTAAEMAAMSPGALGRLILVAPVGLKPEAGEIFDVFYHPVAKVHELSVHDPAAVPEWPALFGTPPTPAEQDIVARNREMTARLAWKPYMHNPRLGRFLPRVTNPTLIVWGRQDRLVPVVCGEQYRRALPHATLTVLERCGHLPALEHPETFARLVLEFLSGRSAE
jgi:pimeloyl-ACP methyl ester carboxylesterase